MSPNATWFKVVIVALTLLACSTCLPSWSLTGPYACQNDATCAPGYQCDEDICCVPGGSPACPTIAYGPKCPDGTTPLTLFEDLDADGWGNDQVTSARCAIPKSGRWVIRGGDCDDASRDSNPDTAEKCNGIDDNCNGDIDETLVPRTTFFRDEDGDTYGKDTATKEACVAPRGYVNRGGDCDDFSPALKPGGRELCNGLDDNCNGMTDEAPLSDVFNPGMSGDTDFECVTGLLGACAAGNLQCVNHQQVCISRRAPSREVCDGVDNDCNNTNGEVDEQPECGGPMSLRGPDVRAGAKMILRTVGAPLITDQCMKGVTSAGAETWNASTGTWTFTQPNDSNLHVLWFEPADGGVWDLSRNNLSLQLDVTASWTPGFSTDAGAWSDSNAGGVRNPVIYACGNSPDQFVRYVPPAGQYLQKNVMSMSQKIPLAGSSGWIIGKGSGFDMSTVTHIEVLLWPNTQSQSTNFTLQFAPTSGFAK